MLSQDWPMEAIHPNDRNPRRDVGNDPDFLGLVASIKSQGIIQPLLINRDGLILAGHRRYAAALELNLQRIPVRVLPEKNNHTLVPLIENLQRANLAVMEIADYMLECRNDHGVTSAAIAEITGISETTIGQYIKLAQAPAELRERVERDDITLGAALAMLPHGEAFIREVIQEPHLTRDIVRDRAREYRTFSKPIVPRTTETSRRCPPELKPHLEWAIQAVRDMLESAPNDDFKVRYQRWLRVLEDDLADLGGDAVEPSFAGAIASFQRSPQIRAAK
jgi:ParB/RepB/Spo0J family partition protein